MYCFTPGVFIRVTRLHFFGLPQQNSRGNDSLVFAIIGQRAVSFILYTCIVYINTRVLEKCQTQS